MLHKFQIWRWAQATGLALISANSLAAPVLEEVLVTATKREVGLQDVPIALSVMGSEKMSEQGIATLEDMAVFMPNVHIAEAGGGDQLFIRGVGSGVNYGFEQSVGTFIDGVYFGRGQASRSAFLDVARVEILKGPQSTLFGKNTVAGAINITTKRAGNEFEGLIGVSYEPEFNAFGITVAGSIPITDDIGLRLVAKQTETDGYLKNTANNTDVRQAKNTVGRLVIDWQATNNVDLVFKYETGVTYTRGRQDQISIANDFATQQYRKADPGFESLFDYNKSAINIGDPRPDDAFHDSEWDIFGLTAEFLIDDFTLRSITAYVDFGFESYLDVDYSPIRFIGRGREEAHQQVSQEFIFTSPGGENFDYMAGLYYQSEELSHVALIDFLLSNSGIGTRGLLDLGLLLGQLDSSIHGELEQESETYSAFTQVTWNISNTIHLISGLRYSEDKKEHTKSQFLADLFTMNPDNTTSGINDQVLQFSTDHWFNSEGATRCSGINYSCEFFPDFDNKRKESHVTGDLILQWDVTGDVMSYAKVGNGYKAGGFDESNVRGLPDKQEYEDETVISYELGIKLEFWESRARLNTALFYSHFQDVQVSAFDGNSGFVVGNAAETEVVGIEVDGSVAVTDGLTMIAAIAYLDAAYKNFTDAACNEPQIEQFIAAGGTRQDCTQDLSGKPLQFAPKLSASLAFNYTRLISSFMEFRSGLDILYSGEYEVANDLDPALRQGEYAKYNARVAIAHIENIWSVAVLGKNLSNEKTTTWGNDVPLAAQGYGRTYFQHIDAPRSLELQVSYRF